MLKQTQLDVEKTPEHEKAVGQVYRQPVTSERVTETSQAATQEDWDAMVAAGNRLLQAARHSYNAHYEAAKALNRTHRRVGVWAAVLAAVSGASVLSHVSEMPFLAHGKAYIEIFQGLVALAAATLTTIQTQLDFTKAADSHRQSAVEYSAIRRNLRIMFRLPLGQRDNLRSYFDALQNDLKELGSKSPTIPDKIWKATEQKIMADPSHLMDDSADRP